MKIYCVLLVNLALCGSASIVFGELPPLLTEKVDRQSIEDQQSIEFAPSPAKSDPPALADRLEQASKRVTRRFAEERKLDYGQLERKLAVLFPNSTVSLVPMASKVVVRGQACNSEDAFHILNVIGGEVAEREGLHAPRDIRVAQQILNELRVGSPSPDVHEVLPVPSFKVTPVATMPIATRPLPPLLHQLLTADSCNLLPAACPTGLPCWLAGAPSFIPVPPPPTPVSMSEPVPQVDLRSDPFRFHLARAEEHLHTAGLTDEANQLRMMHQQFSGQHHARLLIAQKESQLRALQSEIATLNQSTAADATQISLRVRLVELVKCDESWEAIEPLFKVHSVGDTSLTGFRHSVQASGGGACVLNNGEFHQKLDQLCQSGAVKIVSEPQMTTLSGQKCQFLSGGEVAVPSGIDVGGEQKVSYRSFGTSVIACPEVVGDRIRLSITAESRCREDVIQQVGTCPNGASRIEASVEMRSDETLVLAGLKGQRSRTAASTPTSGVFTQVGQLIDEQLQSDREEVELLLVITPEIVRAMPCAIVPAWSGLIPVSGTTWSRLSTGSKPDVRQIKGVTLPQPK